MKFFRGSDALHNFVGHPLMQIFNWLKLTRLANWIHDVTLPAEENSNE